MDISELETNYVFNIFLKMTLAFLVDAFFISLFVYVLPSGEWSPYSKSQSSTTNSPSWNAEVFFIYFTQIDSKF